MGLSTALFIFYDCDMHVIAGGSRPTRTRV